MEFHARARGERAFIRDWGAGEARVIAACAAHRLGYTVLRPTLIYPEGRDGDVSRIAGLPANGQSADPLRLACRLSR
ncbi:hypothetical protein [Rhodopseudomonas palustris]|uniref:hypothetical protein n=1 Tax=Rhodopseudomonas palustris TaxID=1076 RepID=UPI0001649586|nr:hypothetical protein [Rhodopseudomonas palustris]